MSNSQITSWNNQFSPDICDYHWKLSQNIQKQKEVNQLLKEVNQLIEKLKILPTLDGLKTKLQSVKKTADCERVKKKETKNPHEK